jgi:hypothetical protein
MQPPALAITTTRTLQRDKLHFGLRRSCDKTKATSNIGSAGFEIEYGKTVERFTVAG